MNPERQPTRPFVSETIRETAAAWLGRRERGFNVVQERDFAEWLAADDRHASAFAEIEATWRALDCAGALRIEGPPDPDLLAPRRSWTRILPVAFAAAAALAIGYVSWWRPAYAPFRGTAVTHVGEARNMTLPDGSVVRLNTDTAVAIHFTSAERRVILTHGEAYFTVAKNPARPFIVAAGHVAVRAVGTAFNVRMDSADVEVLVTEGAVRVASTTRARASDVASVSSARTQTSPTPPGEAEPFVAAGEKLTISVAQPLTLDRPVPAPVRVPAPEIDRMLAWHQERLEFVSARMSTVVAQFNRYNRHQLVIVDPRLADVRFGGSFRPDAYDAMVRLLETNFGVTAERQENRTLLRLAP